MSFCIVLTSVRLVNMLAKNSNYDYVVRSRGPEMPAKVCRRGCHHSCTFWCLCQRQLHISRTEMEKTCHSLIQLGYKSTNSR